MKTSTVLIAAKEKLSRTHRHGICYAIGDAAYCMPGSVAAGERAKDIIAARISPFTMAPHWLASKMSAGDRGEWIDKQGPEAIQAWRHAWLDQLIVEFKSKGD